LRGEKLRFFSISELDDYFTVRLFTDSLSNNLQTVGKGRVIWCLLFCYILHNIIFCRRNIQCRYFCYKKEGSTVALNHNLTLNLAYGAQKVSGKFGIKRAERGNK